MVFTLAMIFLLFSFSHACFFFFHAVLLQGALVFSHSFEAAPLDPNLEHSVVLAHGPDRPGLVALVSSAIVDHAGGSISESKSVQNNALPSLFDCS